MEIRLNTCPLTSRLSRSLQVIETHTNGSATYDFLLSFHTNHEPDSYRFRDKDRFQSKIAVYLMSPLTESPWYWVTALGLKNLE